PPRLTLFPYTTLFLSALGIGSAKSGCTVTFATDGRRARHPVLVRRLGPSIGKGHGKRLDPTIGTFIWVVRSLRIGWTTITGRTRSEEHTSELQSRSDI